MKYHQNLKYIVTKLGAKVTLFGGDWFNQFGIFLKTPYSTPNDRNLILIHSSNHLELLDINRKHTCSLWGLIKNCNTQPWRIADRIEETLNQETPLVNADKVVYFYNSFVSVNTFSCKQSYRFHHIILLRGTRTSQSKKQYIKEELHFLQIWQNMCLSVVQQITNYILIRK